MPSSRRSRATMRSKHPKDRPQDVCGSCWHDRRDHPPIGAEGTETRPCLDERCLCPNFREPHYPTTPGPHVQTLKGDQA